MSPPGESTPDTPPTPAPAEVAAGRGHGRRPGPPLRPRPGRGPGRPRPVPRARRDGPAARSSSWPSAPAGSPCRWPRPATTSPASTSIRRCSPGPGSRRRQAGDQPPRSASSRATRGPSASTDAGAVPARDHPAQLDLPDGTRADQAAASRRLAAPPRPGRSGGRRRLAAGRRRPGPLRRPPRPRVGSRRSGDRPDRDEDGCRRLRRRDRRRRPRRRSSTRDGPGEPAVRWVRRDRPPPGRRRTSWSAFAEAAGLEVETLAGDYDLEPLGPGAERAVLVARRP